MRPARLSLLFLPLAVALAGCGGGGYKFAPVSGRVTLNGGPLADAFVEFQPMAASKNTDPGPGSVGKTDADGRYTLRSQLDPDQAGAVVGKHRVRITPAGAAPAGDADAADPTKKKKAAPPAVPRRYNIESELTAEVPAGGTDKADFALTSP